jgi:hypothetical protein
MDTLTPPFGIRTPGSSIPLIEDLLADHIRIWTQDSRYKAVAGVLGDITRLPELQAPAVFVNDIPMTVYGVLEGSRKANIPCVIVQLVSWENDPKVGKMAVHIGVLTYDDAEDMQGHRDIILIMSRIWFNLWHNRMIGYAGQEESHLYRYALTEPWISAERVWPGERPTYPFYFGSIITHYSLITPNPRGIEGEPAVIRGGGFPVVSYPGEKIVGGPPSEIPLLPDGTPMW